MKRIMFLIIFILILLTPSFLASLPVISVKASESQSKIMNSYSEKSAETIRKSIRVLGFFYLESDFDELSNIDIEFEVLVFQKEDIFLGYVSVKCNNAYYEKYFKNIIVKSNNLNDIHLLLAKQIVELHREIPFRSSYNVDNEYIYYEFGKYSFMSEVCLRNLENSWAELVSITRYETIVKMKEPYNISIEHEEDFREVSNNIDKELESNYIKKYSFDYSQNTQYNSLFLNNLFISNPLINLVLPGVGSYLTVKTFNFEEVQLSYFNIGATSFLYYYQLLYFPYKGNFDNSWWPWYGKYEGNKEDKKMHKFLIMTIPLNFTVSYMDHFYQNVRYNKVLPPFYENIDTASMLFSVFIPGGGFFYKGYRGIGWFFWFSEYFAALTYLGSWDYFSKEQALYGLSFLKISEIISVFIVNHNYNYNIDDVKLSFTPLISSDMKKISLSVNYSF